MIGQVVLAALQIVAAVAPGFLAAFSGHKTDAEALATAEKAVQTVPEHPAEDGLKAWREHLAEMRKP